LRKKTIEDYIELIYKIQQEKKLVHTNDIAQSLDINPSSVTEIFQKLKEEEYINYEKYSGVTLSKKGLKIAINTKKKHEKITEFLRLLGIDKKTAEEDACEMEHFLHPITMDTIIKFVEVVKMCEATPYWLYRLKKYVETGKLSKCPTEIFEICQEYTKNKN
jgi:DtxR family Mn-dependent transcriptional regulator